MLGCCWEDYLERGEVWWAFVDEKRPVVVLSREMASEFRAMQIVAPASVAEKRGFLLLSPGEAAELGATPDVRGVGVEVEIGTREGLPYEGVVRVALPHRGHIFCTWLVTLTRDNLIERAGVLSPAKLAELETALRLAGIE